jgi:hypothetical protein
VQAVKRTPPDVDEVPAALGTETLRLELDRHLGSA